MNMIPWMVRLLPLFMSFDLFSLLSRVTIGLGNRVIQSLYQKRGEELPSDFTVTKDSKVDKCIEKVAELYQPRATAFTFQLYIGK